MDAEKEQVTNAVREVRVGRIAGLSSYELAVKHGYTKTEQEFVNEQIGNAFLIQELIDKVDALSRQIPRGVRLVVVDGELKVEYDETV